MKTIITVALFLLASAVVAEESIDSDNDGMPDAWEKQYGLNTTNTADAVVDTDGDGFSNLEEFKAKTNPLDKRSHPTMADYALYVDKVETRGTNRWVRFLQFGGKPVWVREGKPDGPVGGVPDLNNRQLWQKISNISIADSAKTNIQVIITFKQDDGKTNTWSVPFAENAPRQMKKENN